LKKRSTWNNDNVLDVGEPPKPTMYGVRDGFGRATFNLEELKQFVRETKDTRLVVRGENGDVVGVLQLRPIRELLFPEETCL
jgi:hypothetical protein